MPHGLLCVSYIVPPKESVARAALTSDVGGGEQEVMGELPDIVHMPNCCGEFVVSRSRVLARPRSFYQNALNVMQARCPIASPLPLPGVLANVFAMKPELVR